MAPEPGVLRDVFDRLPKVTTVIGVAVASLSPFLLPDRLVPAQLDVLRPATSLLIFVAIVMSWTFQPRLRHWLGPLAIAATVAVLALLALQILLVTRVDEYGEPPETHYFLTGYRITPAGTEMLERVGATTVSRAEQIRRAGDDNIPVIFGGSYRIAALLYTLAVVMFVLSATMTLGAVEVEMTQKTKTDAAGASQEDEA